MTGKRVALATLIERRLALKWLRDRGLGVVQRLRFRDDVRVIAGPYYENRAMRRAQGARGTSGLGLGAMAPSIKTRRGRS